MRHQKKGHRLGRTTSHRKATLAALSTALIEHKRITTTLPKAKALRPYVEPLITRAKEDTTHNRRQVFRKLQSKAAVGELFGEVAAQVGDRPGGYTRVIRLGQRFGDGAEMAVIELVDYNDVQPEDTGGGRSRTRRGGGRGRRRRSRSQQPTQSSGSDSGQPTAPGTPETSETEVVDQQPAAASKEDAGPEAASQTTATVETPVADEVAEPVEQRTEGTPAGVEEEVVEELKEQAPEAEAQEPPEEEEQAPEAEAQEPSEEEEQATETEAREPSEEEEKKKEE